MSPEFTPPSSEKPFNTPELPDEAEDEYNKILTQIEEWHSEATRHHPSLTPYSMAYLINLDCAVDEEGNPITDTPRLGRNHEEKMNQRARAARMRKIAPYANNAAIDAVPFRNLRAQNYFETIESHASKDSGNYTEFEDALKKVMRIVKVREALAEQIDYVEYNGQINELIQDIAYRLLQDVNKV